MSDIRGFAETQADNYLACMIGAYKHPHYHDCENCSHFYPGTLCEWAKIYALQTIIDAQEERHQKIMAEHNASLEAMTSKPSTPFRFPPKT